MEGLEYTVPIKQLVKMSVKTRVDKFIKGTSKIWWNEGDLYIDFYTFGHLEFRYVEYDYLSQVIQGIDRNWIVHNAVSCFKVHIARKYFR